MFRKVSASGNWRLTARTASVAGVKPIAHVNKICLLSLFSSDLKVEIFTAANLVARSMTRIRRPIDRLLTTRAGVNYESQSEKDKEQSFQKKRNFPLKHFELLLDRIHVYLSSEKSIQEVIVSKNYAEDKDSKNAIAPKKSAQGVRDQDET